MSVDVTADVAAWLFFRYSRYPGELPENYEADARILLGLLSDEFPAITHRLALEAVTDRFHLLHDAYQEEEA
jgi:hypothetical protein